ncbi:hypothetical protein J8655_04160 [Dickeya oryzae]|nr:hypothetical protein [Dickeya oryzae]MBP2844685.1 hypothetical protein [Dickeya oryzae]
MRLFKAAFFSMDDYISVFLILYFFMDEYEEEDSGAIYALGQQAAGQVY